MHGWAISERLQQVSHDAVQVLQGSLYPALHRLERRGWVKAKWDISENNRRAKYYELTAQGRKQLETETAAWGKLTSAVDEILHMAEGVSMLNDLIYRLRAFFSRQRVEDELQGELHYHLEREAEKYRKAGASPEEAM